MYSKGETHFRDFVNWSVRKYMENLARGKPKCLSMTKTVKSKCDGTFSTDEVCDEYGTTATCCTSDCKLKPDAACSPVTSNFSQSYIPISLYL